MSLFQNKKNSSLEEQKKSDLDNSFIHTERLSVGYHGIPLIKDITVEFQKGEIITLIGPNGSGKSTILKSITKHLQLVGGAVFIGKDDLKNLTYKELSKKTAVVLTERIKPELMTCRDVVASGRYPYTNGIGLLKKSDEEIIDEAMLEVNVLELSSKSFLEISDGQKQRILLARAICQQPEIIVLDEPTSFLDIRYKIELLGILRRMAREKGTTVIMSLHEIDLAQKISDRIMCVNGDKIECFGTPDEIFKGDLIQKLYGIEKESFNLLFGSIELPKVTKEPDTFVISGAGSGISVFRDLQKKGIPFYAGILFSNDIDYQIAKALAKDVAVEEAFEKISDEVYEKACHLMDKCSDVIVCDVKIGEQNKRLLDLIKKADEKHKKTLAINN